MSVISNNQLAGAAGQGGADFQIDRSLRFNSNDTASLSRTPSSAGNRKTWTWSGWVKRSGLGAFQYLFDCGSGSSPQEAPIRFWSDDRLDVSGYTTSAQYALTTTAKFRDTSAWYHIVVAFDTTKATADDRIKLYVNGAQITTFDTRTNPAQNTDYYINNAIEHNIGRAGVQNNRYFNGYLADVHFIDGQQLAATDFGEYDDNNVWQPKEFTGSHNATGFTPGANISYGSWADVFNGSTTGHAFTYSSATSTATLSPGIAWSSKVRIYGLQYTTSHVKINGGSALTGFSGTAAWVDVTSQVGSSGTLSSVQINDVGTNYFKLFAIELDDTILDLSQAGVNGFHLDFSDNSSNAALGTDSSGSSNTWTVNNLIAQSSNTPTTPSSGYNDNTLGYYLNNNPPLFLTKEPDGNDRGDGVTHGSGTGTTWAVDDVLQWAIDWTGGKIWFGRNNTWYSGNPSAGTDPSVSSVANQNLYLALHYNSSDFELQVPSSASYTLPSGFSYWGGATLGTWKVSGTNQGGCPDIFSTTIPTSGKIYIEAIIKGGTSVYANVGLMNVGETQVFPDSLIDTPTNYDADSGNNGGNYATWSPLAAQSSGSITLSNGNLDTACGSTRTTVMSTFPLTGKTYWEVTFGAGTSNIIGMTEATGFNTVANNNSGIKYVGYKSYSYGWHQGNGNLYNVDSLSSSPGTYSNGDVVGWAYDADNNTLKLYKNGSLQHTQTGISNAQYFPAITHQVNGATATANFGARPFAHTPPSGYKALCTTNLSDPTIADGSTAFDAKTFTANASNQTITTGFSPDLVWVKSRANAYGNELYDIVRGTNLRLTANTTAAEQNLAGQLTAFNSDGFTLGSASSSNYTNNTASIAWAWDAGSSTVSNTDGSMTSSVRANQSSGFSIVEYTGNASNSTVGHGLGAAPEFIIIKLREDASGWSVYHDAIGTSSSNYIELQDSAGSSQDNTAFQNTAPTNNVFSIGTKAAVNNNGDSHIAYCFAPVEGYSAFGSYTGNGSTDGVFIYTGFTPRWLLFKRHDSSSDWTIYDTARDPHNVAGNNLKPNTTGSETGPGTAVDILSNGFKFRRNSLENGGNDQYIYAAFAEHPFKTARAR